MLHTSDVTRSTTIGERSRPQPEGGQAPVVQRLRIRYAKRGPLRFTSHRDFARAFERALRRANVPVAFSQGFTPHPKISYAGAAPTGAASEAEYLEVGLRAAVDPAQVRRALDAALPPGLDIVQVVPAGAPGGFAERIDAARWRVELSGVRPEVVQDAVGRFLAAREVLVERLTKQGMRTLDTRAPVVSMTASPAGHVAGGVRCVIIDLVVRQVIPSVRPDDILSGLRALAGLEPPVPPRVTRLEQGRLTAEGEIIDPLAADRDGVAIGEH